jgi:hypothetical protein
MQSNIHKLVDVITLSQFYQDDTIVKNTQRQLNDNNNSNEEQESDYHRHLHTITDKVKDRCKSFVFCPMPWRFKFNIIAILRAATRSRR